ncbi:hypothetical protein HBH64_235610 [Parastagonospora nodorum]|nr:hypothetical protein HBH49_055860 [Parastagonospora nodorum]KAH4309596.1 hypothetical protein HBI01_031670 [Parastagonospora nodorum]KAH4314573.1 hypothetical protein HBI02_067080 [Parastagonospora nodorum]KAH4334708.1 hypothetical protein HBI00_029820 [Parastagonospora nodorum]KAH4381224.1 hypothetical protein HBH94_073770 [Parastagonospora nodorum]
MAESTHQEPGTQRYGLDLSDAESECAIPLDDLQIGDSRPSYQYEKLPHADSIRLVKIFSIHPEIACKIRVANFSDAPAYEALSYCWGSPEKLVPITCDGRLFEVSPSLRDGLQQLYQYSKTSGTSWFWIDQICIDQKDGLERTHQVQLMNKIYSSSIRTVIWLPLDEPTVVAAKSLILDFHRCLVARGEIRAEIEEREGVVEEVYSQATVKIMPSREDGRWPALRELLGLPWFKRVWVIQEVALSTRPAIMLCGTQNLLWPVLYETIRWMYSHALEVDLVVGMSDAVRLGIIGMKTTWVDGSDQVTWDLQSLLLLSENALATVTNDQVFALLGLCRDTRDPGNWPVELNPDYDRPQAEVFMSVTRYCIHQNCNLDILQLVDATAGTLDDGNPSWVLKLGLYRQRLRVDTAQVFTHSNHRTLETAYSDASNGLHPAIDDKTAPEILRLRGTRVDKAILFCRNFVGIDFFDSSGNRKKDDTRLRDDIRAMLEFCEECLPHLPIAEVRRAFFLATTMGLTPEYEDAADGLLVHFETFLGIREEITTEVNHAPWDRPDPGRYSLMLKFMEGRRVFITSQGRIGIGPDHMEPNDVIAVLFGGKFPLVLRPKENGRWRFIGLCYIHGYMKGEALQGDGAKEENHEWFELV